jgi:hypothetical protein
VRAVVCAKCAECRVSARTFSLRPVIGLEISYPRCDTVRREEKSREERGGETPHKRWDTARKWVANHNVMFTDNKSFPSMMVARPTLRGQELRTMCGMRGTARGRSECCRRQLMRGAVRLLQDLEQSCALEERTVTTVAGGEKPSHPSISRLIPNAAALAAVICFCSSVLG